MCVSGQNWGGRTGCCGGMGGRTALECVGECWRQDSTGCMWCRRALGVFGADSTGCVVEVREGGRQYGGRTALGVW